MNFHLINIHSYEHWSSSILIIFSASSLYVPLSISLRDLFMYDAVHIACSSLGFAPDSYSYRWRRSRTIQSWSVIAIENAVRHVINTYFIYTQLRTCSFTWVGVALYLHVSGGHLIILFGQLKNSCFARVPSVRFLEHPEFLHATSAEL